MVLYHTSLQFDKVSFLSYSPGLVPAHPLLFVSVLSNLNTNLRLFLLRCCKKHFFESSSLIIRIDLILLRQKHFVFLFSSRYFSLKSRSEKEFASGWPAFSWSVSQTTSSNATDATERRRITPNISTPMVNHRKVYSTSTIT